MKKYMLNLLKILIKKYNAKPPFLDVGGGIGDVSFFLFKNGWYGKLIDNSNDAIKKVKRLLQNTNIIVEKKNAFQEKGKYKTIVLFDILEHVKNDKKLLKSLNKNLETGGYIILSVPVNKREWRWDDEFYGHYRRYEINEILSLLKESGYKPLENLDFSFPFFWIMRRVYTKMFKKEISKNKSYLTQKSSYSKAWDKLCLNRIISYNPLWWILLKIQLLFRKIKISQNQIIIAKK